ncbi:MAG: tRNA threonylcarbamoyladenosine dehydratase [Bacilli bacterium]|nr:tRNA threonylcarbamoyladenosine dehydratase [Bacilli bacterium]
MKEQFSRTKRLVGDEAMETLYSSHVAVFGVGGVGGYVVEALARSGVGHFTIVDDDKVCITNLNRQIIATYDTIGKDKCDVMKERILSINPDAEVEIRKCFYLPENADTFDFNEYSYVIDCVDTVSAKLSIVEKATKLGVNVISAMGAGNKMNPADLEVSDISKTEMDPLAKVMRRELRARGINHLKVVYSKEQPLVPFPDDFDDGAGKTEERKGAPKKMSPGSNAFVPSAMGLIIASEVIKDLIGYKK